MKSKLPAKINEVINSSGISDLNLAESIGSNFAPYLIEITEETDKLKKLKIGNPEDAETARRVNITLGKIRILKNNTKKEQKDYYLTVSKFIDSLSNVSEGLISMGQKTAQEFSKYEEKMEKERLEKLKNERNSLMAPYSDFEIPNIELVSEEAFAKMLENYRIAHNARIEAEEKAEAERIEAERIEEEKLNLSQKRQVELRPFYRFIEDDYNLREMPEDEYQKILNNLTAKAKAYEDDQEKIRLENIRLIKEKEKREKIDNEKRIELARREKLMKPFIQFIRNYSEMLQIPIREFEKELQGVEKEANDYWESERKEQEKAKADREARQKAERELKSRREAEQKKEAERRAQEEAERRAQEELLKSGDKNRLKDWVNSTLIKPLSIQGMSKESIAVSDDIFEKFSSFKMWAWKEIDKL